MTVKYTKEKITILMEGKEVFCSDNPYKDAGPTRPGLFIEWGEFWFKNIKLRKLNK
jgi:hypothetical protein